MRYSTIYNELENLKTVSMIIPGLLTTKPMLGRSLFLLKNGFLAHVLPNLNRSG